MCFYHGKYGNVPPYSREIEFDDIKKIIDELEKFNVKYILTGGEPLLRKDFGKIIDYLSNKKIRYNLITNGVLITKSIVKKTSKSNAINVSFSIDGPREIHEKIRGKPHVFEKTVKSIELFNKYANHVPKTIATTITKENIDYLDEMVALAKRLETRLVFIHLQFLNKDEIYKHNLLSKKYFGIESHCNVWFQNKFNIYEVEKICEKIELIKKLAKELNVNVDFLPNLNDQQTRNYYLENDYRHLKTCNLPWRHIVIDPYGNIYPCYPERFNYCIGNIRNTSIIDAFENEKANFFRSTLKREKLFPACKRCCSLKTSYKRRKNSLTHIIEIKDDVMKS
jgi:radical SAM protein with 4Fe4S-binding SPASM domain